MNEVIREFLIETHENLAQLDVDLVTLEKDPTEHTTLARVFRTLHTVKGTAGFLGLEKLQAVAHAAENLLSRLREGELVFNAEIASALLAVVDAVRKMLEAVEASETDGDGNFSSLIETLERLQTASGTAPTLVQAPPSQPSPSPEQPSTMILSSAPAPAAAPSSQPASTPSPSAQPASTLIQPPPARPAAAASPAAKQASTLIQPPPPQPASAASPFGSPAAAPASASKSAPANPAFDGGRTIAVPAGGVPRAAASTSFVLGPAPPQEAAAETRAPAVSDSSIRVDVGLLDKLMNLVGELVLARNQIMQFSATQENAPFLGTVQRLNLLTTELQAGVMKTRMQPIGTIWSKFPRVVRDQALACGKQAGIDLEGQETELDKTIIEAIRDPLTHLIRNAVDHGIEPPAQREARGKLAEGRLSLHAFHEGGKVIIEISDDGAGIDPQRIRAKAISAKLVTPEQADRLSDRDLINLIFLPGFSTADRVTQFSGRGVGMDVVRTNIERIGGSVTIDSRLGVGATVRMKIPLTLAIIPALTITSAGDRYAIPQVSLLELVRLEGEQAQRGIEEIHGAPVYRLRGNLLPLIYLNRQLHPEISAAAGKPGQGRRSDEAAALTHSPSINIVVLQADDRHFGLIVDAIHDTEEIVVKPLQKQLKGVTAFAGATIMGDGRVALILDVLGLAQQANVVSGVRERALSEKTASAAGPTGDRQTVLLFATHEGGRMAIPLSQVARLEEFQSSSLERVGPQDVVQYRDEILPLIHVSKALRQHRPLRNGRSSSRRRSGLPTPARDNGTVQVVVYASNGRRVGLVVDRILDIVEETLISRSTAHRRGVLFTAVIQGRVTEFLDMDSILGSVDPDLVEPQQTIAMEV